MNSNVRRQIKDIQLRAEHLLKGNPSVTDIEEFDQYNEELKRYLMQNVTDPELVDRVLKIPKILEESNRQVVARSILSAVFAMFTSWLVSYFQEKQRIENCKDSIREARSSYASIEFFMRNL